MLKPFALLTLGLAAASAFAAPTPEPTLRTEDPIQSMMRLDQELDEQLALNRLTESDGFREDLPVSVDGQKSPVISHIAPAPPETSAE